MPRSLGGFVEYESGLQLGNQLIEVDAFDAELFTNRGNLDFGDSLGSIFFQTSRPFPRAQPRKQREINRLRKMALTLFVGVGRIPPALSSLGHSPSST
jgi:hypothetical protein